MGTQLNNSRLVFQAKRFSSNHGPSTCTPGCFKIRALETSFLAAHQSSLLAEPEGSDVLSPDSNSQKDSQVHKCRLPGPLWNSHRVEMETGDLFLQFAFNPGNSGNEAMCNNRPKHRDDFIIIIFLRCTYNTENVCG